LPSYAWHDGKMKDRVCYRLLREEYENSINRPQDFWTAADNLVASSNIVIDRPKGTRHPKFPDILYGVDYGYLENTVSPDGGGIDVWKGSLADERLDALIATVDLMKKDSEIKLLIGCTEAEKRMILSFHNESDWMKGVLIKR